MVRDMTSQFHHELSGPGSLRRSHRRYPMNVELEYKLLDGKKVLKSGSGRTLNLSSSGVLFECDEPLPLGAQIRLLLIWPAQLNDRVGLTLCVNGRTVRSVGTCTAMEIVSHEFRTRPLQMPATNVRRAKTVADMRQAAMDVRTMSA